MTPRERPRLGPILRLAIACANVAACVGSPVASAAPASPTPQVSISGAIDLARGQIQAALGGRRVELQVPQQPYRPAESPSMAGAARAVFQAVLPEDPSHGYVVVYEFADSSSAAAAGADQARYVVTGPGRVQFAFGTQFVIRQLDTTVIFYSWVPGSSPDPQAPDVAAALASIGRPIPVSG